MKNKLTSVLALCVAAMAFAPMVSAQGVIVHKKNGSTITVPYSELDSITTYNYNETPTPGDSDGDKTFKVNGVSFRMKFVDGGTFDMGATNEQYNGFTPYDNETPKHRVTVDSYYMGETEVTQALWYEVMGYNPATGYGTGDNYPAYYISYDDCLEFIGKLNQMTGMTFRMPTEAEWEYAARGGKKTGGHIFSGSDNIGDVAWYYGNSGNSTHEVATKAPNELGLYDMSGNVQEWCSDWYGSNYYSQSIGAINPNGPSSGSYRVCRGGDFGCGAGGCRSANRSNFAGSSFRSGDLGLRLAL